MSWNKQEGNNVTETISSADLTEYTSKYGFTLQNDETSEYITQNIDNYVNIEKNGNITSVSLQQVDDSSYYKLNMNLNNNDTISESVITIKPKNIRGTNNLTYTLKQIFGKKIWLKLFSNDNKFISDKYYAIKINTETIYLYNTPVYNSASTIKNSENAPIYTGSVNDNIDIYLQPKYGIASNLGFIDNYTTTNPIQYNISRIEEPQCTDIIGSTDESGKINDLKIDGYSESSENIPNMEAIFKFEKSEYPTINLHIVNDLIQFIYSFSIYLKYSENNLYLKSEMPYTNQSYGEFLVTIKFKDINGTISTENINLRSNDEFIYIYDYNIQNFKLLFNLSYNYVQTDQSLINSNKIFIFDIYAGINGSNNYIKNYNMSDTGICFRPMVDATSNTMYMDIIIQNNELQLCNFTQSEDHITDRGTITIKPLNNNKVFITNDNQINNEFCFDCESEIL